MADQEKRKHRPSDRRWYGKRDKPHDGVLAAVDKLLEDPRRERLAYYRALYLDEDREGWARKGYGRDVDPSFRARFNVIRSTIETLLARVGKNQPRPWVVTTGGKYKLQRKAKAMGKYLEGEFSRLEHTNLSEAGTGTRLMTLLDGLCFGTGAIKVASSCGRPTWHRTRRENLLIDRREEMANHVRTLYEVMFIDREVAAETWPDHRNYILNEIAPADNKALPASSDMTDDLIMLCEAWHLPPGPDAYGRHCICADGLTLWDDDKWTRSRFPFAMIHAKRDPWRVLGFGYPECMEGLQDEQNALCEAISKGAILWAGWLAVQVGGVKVLDAIDGMTNEIAGIMEYTGTVPPQVIQPPPANPALMGYAAEQRQAMRDQEGISYQSATGNAAQNLSSGKAILATADIESERHVLLGQANERLTIDLADLTIEETEAIAEDYGTENLITYAGKHTLEELKWTDVHIANAHFEVRTWPMSQLANSPQGRLAQLQEMMAAGMITPIEARRLYDFPDVENHTAHQAAGVDLAEKLIDAALDGKSVAATRACDLNHLVEWGWKEHAFAQLQGAEDDELIDLRNLLGHAESLIQQLGATQSMAAPPPPGAQAQPPAGPAQPPGPMAGPIGIAS